MNTEVNKLLDVDKQARRIIDEAQQYYDRTLADIEAEKQKLTADYERKAKAHYDQIEAVERASERDAASKLEEKLARFTAEMDEAFEKGHAAWEDGLFARCVGRQDGRG